jgi:hypothetical protein
LFSGPQFANDAGQWCARTVVERSATGPHWTRSVYFYDPGKGLRAEAALRREPLEEVLETTQLVDVVNFRR